MAATLTIPSRLGFRQNWTIQNGVYSVNGPWVVIDFWAKQAVWTNTPAAEVQTRATTQVTAGKVIHGIDGQLLTVGNIAAFFTAISGDFTQYGDSLEGFAVTNLVGSTGCAVVFDPVRDDVRVIRWPEEQYLLAAATVPCIANIAGHAVGVPISVAPSAVPPITLPVAALFDTVDRPAPIPLNGGTASQPFSHDTSILVPPNAVVVKPVVGPAHA